MTAFILLLIFCATTIYTQMLRKDLRILRDPISAYLTPVKPLGWVQDAGFVCLGAALWLLPITGTAGLCAKAAGAAVFVVMLSAVWRSELPIAQVKARQELEDLHLVSAALAFVFAALLMFFYALHIHNHVLLGLAIALPVTALTFYVEWRKKTAISEKLAIAEILAYLFVLLALSK